MMGNIAFDALRDLRFRSMIVRLDGDLAGEFATRLTIDGVALGQTGTQKIVRSLLSKLPLKLNVSIIGPFRALIATAKAFRDPRDDIDDALPRPLDEVPGIVTEVRRREEEQDPDPNPGRAEDRSHPATHQPKRVKPMTRAKHKTLNALGRGACCCCPLAGCITVSPPDKPIEINLNVKIEQEVLVRLQRDVEQLIQQNPDAFPTTPPRQPQ